MSQATKKQAEQLGHAVDFGDRNIIKVDTVKDFPKDLKHDRRWVVSRESCPGVMMKGGTQGVYVSRQLSSSRCRKSLDIKTTHGLTAICQLMFGSAQHGKTLSVLYGAMCKHLGIKPDHDYTLKTAYVRERHDAMLKAVKADVERAAAAADALAQLQADIDADPNSVTPELLAQAEQSARRRLPDLVALTNDLTGGNTGEVNFDAVIKSTPEIDDIADLFT